MKKIPLSVIVGVILLVLAFVMPGDNPVNSFINSTFFGSPGKQLAKETYEATIEYHKNPRNAGNNAKLEGVTDKMNKLSEKERKIYLEELERLLANH